MSGARLAHENRDQKTDTQFGSIWSEKPRHDRQYHVYGMLRGLAGYPEKFSSVVFVAYV